MYLTENSFVEKIQIIQNVSSKVGFVCFGEVNSPKQSIHDQYIKALAQIKALGFEVVTTEPVTDDSHNADVERAIVDLKSQDFDLLIVCLTGWIPSHTVISVTTAFKHHPMILWGLAGYLENGRIVTMAAQAGTTALRKVFGDLGYKFKFVYDIIGKEPPLGQISSFAAAASATKTLGNSKVGMMGFRDMKLYNTFYEGISLKAKFGIDIEYFEMLEMVKLSEAIDVNQVDDVLQNINADWRFIKPVDEDFLLQGIRYYLAIKKISESNGFKAISLKDVDGMKKLLGFPPAMIFMLLSDKMGICTIPENDAMGAVTQLIIKQVTGQCGAYLEYYEFLETSVLVGVPDFVPAEVVDGDVTVTQAAFGEISGGLLNISAMKTGKITLARLSNTADQYTMHIGTGEAKLRTWEEAGWNQPAPQLPSLEVFLDVPVNDFVQKISGQHYILAYGDHTQVLTDFCYLQNIQVA